MIDPVLNEIRFANRKGPILPRVTDCYCLGGTVPENRDSRAFRSATLSSCVTEKELSIRKIRHNLHTLTFAHLLEISTRFTRLMFTSAASSSSSLHLNHPNPFCSHFPIMDQAINEKFSRLKLLLQGDENLQCLDTKISLKKNARKKDSAPGLKDEETKVSTLERATTAGSDLN